MARHIADVKRGTRSIEEKAEAIESFVTSFFSVPQRLAQKALPSARVRAALLPSYRGLKARRAAAASPEPTPMSVEERAELSYSCAPAIAEQASPTSLEEVMHELDPVTIRFLDTADKLAAALREYDLDWSPAVIMLCKAFEKETNVRLLIPLREKTRGRDLKTDLSDEDLGRIARFCFGAGRAPELGTFGHFLNTAIHSKERRASSILLQSFYDLVSAWPRSQWLVDKFGLSATLKKLTKEFRNRAAHIETLNESEFSNCRNFVRNAPEMVLLRLFLATSE